MIFLFLSQTGCSTLGGQNLSGGGSGFLSGGFLSDQFKTGYIGKTINLTVETMNVLIARFKRTLRGWLKLATFGLYQPKKPEEEKRPDITPGIIQRKTVTDRRMYKLVAKLEAEGVDVVSLGQEYRVIIPSGKLFYAKSPRIRWSQYGILNDVVNYLKQFRTISVTVSAYSKDENIARAGALSYARAEGIANYLWSQAIDTRLIHTQAHNIESVKCCDEQQDINPNVESRVEIWFRDVIV